MRKGQFFIIGAIFICALFFFGVSPVMKISKSPADDMNFIADNLQKELPHALNIGVNSSVPVDTAYGFMNFSRDTVLSKGVALEAVWVIFLPINGSINASAGNLDMPGTVGVNVSGTYGGIYVGVDSVNSSVFAVSEPVFNVTVTVSGESFHATLLTNKTSIYSTLSLEREGNTVRKEILA